MTPDTPLRSAREALKQALPPETSLHGGTPDPRFVHLPSSHVKALHPDAMLVVGMRGAGKTFWWAALQNPRHRRLLEKLAPRAILSESVEVTAGFGERPNPDAYPSRDVLGTLLEGGTDPRQIWRTVVAYHLAGDAHPVRAANLWQKRVRYVVENQEDVDRLLTESDNTFQTSDSWRLIVFDALDRSATDWKQMHALIRGLLQTALDLRPYRRLRLKCFLRTDQLVENAVADFPDASKVLASRVDLGWPAHELYGLLWQHLGNAPQKAGSDFRDETERLVGIAWTSLSLAKDGAEESRVWRPPSVLVNDQEKQRSIFHAITGPWMGRDRRRGFPYTWIPSHLADAQGRASPRSFVAALREAVGDSEQRYPQHEWPLHYESIKRGVQDASRIRVQELQEDYPWVQTIMEPLRGIVVPCGFEEVEASWKNAGVIEGLRKKVEKEEVRLPPEHIDQGPKGVRLDLEALGIFLGLRDGRVNVPDVFRVDYGLGRRGGVPPIGRGGSG